MSKISFKVFNNGIPNDAKEIRHIVFQVEQIFIDDLDDIDKTCFHLMLYYMDNPVGTWRYFCTKKKTYHLGRLAILESYRHLGLGSIMLNKCEEEIKKLGGTRIELGAQYDKRNFYYKNGYRDLDEPIFLDENYPHINLYKDLK